MIAHISDDMLNREESIAEHTYKTAFLCGKKGNRCKLSQFMSLCGILHDMGKNKQEFDDYLHADEKARRKLRGTVAHASTGAKYIYDRHHNDAGNIKFMVEIISYAIAAHHGLFDCVDVDHTDKFSKKLDNVDDYDEAYRNAKQDYLNEYDLDQIFMESSAEFLTVCDEIKTLITRLQPILRSKSTQNVTERLLGCSLFLFSCLQRLVLSILIDSDWEATSDFMDNVDTLAKLSKFNTKEIFEKARGYQDECIYKQN